MAGNRGIVRTQSLLNYGPVDPKAPRPGKAAEAAPGGAPEVQPAETARSEGPGPEAFASETRAFELSGRLDLNQRPLAPQFRPHDQSNDAESRNVSQSDGFPQGAFSMPSPSSAEFRRPFNAPVMQGKITVGADSLLTVKEAAEQLKVSTATVYALCASGQLAHLRISTHAIRIAGEDLGRFVRACVGHR
jgi:excisionase family DNA binding protein